MDDQADALINEVRLLWNTLVEQGERLHADTGITISMRAVLEYLDREGPTTVPTIARDRRVTRQAIQSLVNTLVEEGHVEAVENPAHRRSPLIRLTPSGGKLIRSMRRKEARRIEQADARIPPEDLERAATVLRNFRTALEQ
jgi:DNA-binding MarR family transcriptional regulator